MTPRSVLLVSYLFPPIGGSGVQRVAKLARYLSAAGWRTRVLCARDARYPLMDPTLTGDTGETVEVHRVRGWEPAGLAGRVCRPGRAVRRRSAKVESWESRIYWRLEGLCAKLRVPETELLWVPSAARAARRLVRRHGIDVVVTTSPPNSIHLVGLALRRWLRIPWIADMRDPILGNFGQGADSPAAGRLRRWLEPSIVRRADRTVVTCQDLEDELQGRYRDVPPRRITTITNGFDPEDAPPATPRSSDVGRRFVIAHVGAFYREQSVEPMLRALRLLRQQQPRIAERLEFRIVGSLSAAQRALLLPADRAVVREVGYRPHGEAIREMATADALYLTVPPGPGGRLCIPAKTFEYLAFGGHIIATVQPHTALAELLRRAGNVSLVADRGPETLSAAIGRCFDRWRSGTLARTRDAACIDSYRRERLAGVYAALLDRCVEGASSPAPDAPHLSPEAAA